MALVCAMRVAVAQREQVSAVDVHVVRATEAGGALAVMIEFRVFDQHGPATAENSVLVVVEIAVAYREIVGFIPDSRAVLVLDGRSGEFDILNDNVLCLRNP